MENPILEAMEKAVNPLVADFQRDPDRYWNERDIHWSLAYYLKGERVIQEDYPTQLIRAEFPTVRKYDGARGHYDLVVLDRESWLAEPVQRMKAWDDWDDYLKLVRVSVAVEIKLWPARLRLDRADWDIEKLTTPENGIQNAYFLNFVQLDFSRRMMEDYYGKLRTYLLERTRPGLRVLCVPSEIRVQPDGSDNWLPSR